MNRANFEATGEYMTDVSTGYQDNDTLSIFQPTMFNALGVAV